MARGVSMQRLTRRRTRAAVAAALVAATAVLTASSASPSSSSQADALARDRDAPPAGAGRRGHGDRGKLTAPDFQLINPAGAAAFARRPPGGVDAGVLDFVAIEPSSPIAVRLSGDSATLRYRTATTSSSAGPMSPTRRGPPSSTSVGMDAG